MPRRAGATPHSAATRSISGGGRRAGAFQHQHGGVGGVGVAELLEQLLAAGERAGGAGAEGEERIGLLAVREAPAGILAGEAGDHRLRGGDRDRPRPARQGAVGGQPDAAEAAHADLARSRCRRRSRPAAPRRHRRGVAPQAAAVTPMRKPSASAHSASNSGQARALTLIACGSAMRLLHHADDRGRAGVARARGPQRHRRRRRARCRAVPARRRHGRAARGRRSSRASRNRAARRARAAHRRSPRLRHRRTRARASGSTPSQAATWAANRSRWGNTSSVAPGRGLISIRSIPSRRTMKSSAFSPTSPAPATSRAAASAQRVRDRRGQRGGPDRAAVAERAAGRGRAPLLGEAEHQRALARRRAPAPRPAARRRGPAHSVRGAGAPRRRAAGHARRPSRPRASPANAGRRRVAPGRRMRHADAGTEGGQPVGLA